MADISGSIIGMIEDTQDNGSSQAADQPTPPPPPAPQKAEPHEQFSGGLDHTRSGDDPKDAIPVAPVGTIELDRTYAEGAQTRSTPDPIIAPPTEGGADANSSEE